MFARVALCLLISMVFVQSLSECRIMAQDWPSAEPVQEDEEIYSQPGETGVQSQTVAGGNSLRDSVMLNNRNRVGFSLGLFGLYDRTEFDSTWQPDYDSFEMMVSPTLFVNMGRRKAQFHADYSLEQRFFNDAENIWDSAFHMANLGFLYTPTRRWTITATDELRYAPSNLLSLSGGFSPGLPMDNPVGPGISGYSYEKVFMNRGAADFRYEINRKTSMRFYGNSQVFRYETDKGSNTDAYNIGSSFHRMLNRKLDASIGFMYGRYENVQGLREDEMKRLTVGMGYQINRQWRISGNGGAEWVQGPDYSNTPSYVSAALIRTTDSSVISLSYSKSAQYQLGTPELNKAHTASFSLDQRLSPKSSVMLGAHFYRSEPYRAIDSVNLLYNTLIAGAGYRYKLFNNIMANVSGNHQYQDKGLSVENSSSLHRFFLYAGVEIIFPGVRGR